MTNLSFTSPLNTEKYKFVLSKTVTNTLGCVSPNKFIISVFTSGVAVAVKALIIGLMRYELVKFKILR